MNVPGTVWFFKIKSDKNKAGKVVLFFGDASQHRIGARERKGIFWKNCLIKKVLTFSKI